MALACTFPLVAGCATAPPSSSAPEAAFTPGGPGWEPASGSSASPSGAPPTSAADSRPGVPDAAEEQAVQDAVLAFWTEVQRAAASPRPREPRLARHATGRALQQWQRTIGGLATKKQRYSGRVTADVAAGTVRGRAATATGCVDTTGWVLVSAAGKPVGTPKPATAYAYRLVKVGRAWKVSGQTPKGACRPG